jgi:ubiquinone/menaquinone biosynthesis C-methylase UbiE
MSRTRGGGQRWEATDEERRVADAVSKPLTPKEVARVLLRSPGVVPEAIRIGVGAAAEGLWTSTGLKNLLNAERGQQALPDLVPGAAFYSPEQPFLDALLKCLGSEFTALDLGCGSGRIARHVAPQVRRLVCADVSRLMINRARTHLADHSNIDYRLVGGRSLGGLATATFDVVYAHAVFTLFDLVPALGLLDEVCRVLRPGGAAVISFKTIDRPLWAAQALTDTRLAMRRGRGAGRFRPYTTGQLEAMFELVGMPVVDRCSSDGDDPRGYVVLTGKSTRERLKAEELEGSADRLPRARVRNRDSGSNAL